VGTTLSFHATLDNRSVHPLGVQVPVINPVQQA
jgi:hypothetical protein